MGIEQKRKRYVNNLINVKARLAFMLLAATIKIVSVVVQLHSMNSSSPWYIYYHVDRWTFGMQLFIDQMASWAIHDIVLAIAWRINPAIAAKISRHWIA